MNHLHSLPNDLLLNDHLTETQLDDVLMGDASATVLTHYESCGECSAKVSVMMSAIESFNNVTMEWSERRSATLPAQPVTDGSVWGHKLNWVLAAAVIVIGVVVLPLVTRSSPGGAKVAVADQAQASTPHQSAPSAATEVATTASPATDGAPVHTAEVAQVAQPAQVAKDNRMLQAIDQQLDASVASPTEIFGIEAPQGGSRSQQQDLPTAIWD